MGETKIHHKVCEVCHGDYTSLRINSRWCGKECRNAARYTDNKSATYRSKGSVSKSGKMCAYCGRDRGPNFSICQICVKATRGGYDESLALVAW